MEANMKTQLKEVKQKVDDLYGKIVRASVGEHNDIGIVILDVDKLKNKIYEIKVIIDEIDTK